MNINQLLVSIGWTSEELAARLDVSTDTVRKWRRGRRTPPDSVLDWLGHVAECQARAGSAPADWFSGADREAAE